MENELGGLVAVVWLLENHMPLKLAYMSYNNRLLNFY